MKKILISVALLSTLCFAGNFMEMGKVGDLHVMLSSDKVLSMGENRIKVELNKGEHGGEVVIAKDVRIKFFMPEMPGMPYMELKDICKKTGDNFECSVNFAMNGTWQYQLFIKDDKNKDYKYKGSATLGQSSSAHNH